MFIDLAVAAGITAAMFVVYYLITSVFIAIGRIMKGKK